MSRDFYSELLGVPPGARPPDHFALLGLPRLCRDLKRIEKSARHRLDQLDRFHSSRDAEKREACLELMDEIAEARTVLVDAQSFDDYARSLGMSPSESDSASGELVTISIDRPDRPEASDRLSSFDAIHEEEKIEPLDRLTKAKKRKRASRPDTPSDFTTRLRQSRKRFGEIDDLATAVTSKKGARRARSGGGSIRGSRAASRRSSWALTFGAVAFVVAAVAFMIVRLMPTIAPPVDDSPSNEPNLTATAKPPVATTPGTLTVPSAFGDVRYTIELISDSSGSGVFARGINGQGDVVGEATFGAFLWRDGVLYDLGPRAARDINDAGQVALYGMGVLWRWDQDTGFTNLSSLGGTRGTVSAIDENGWVVGQSQRTDGSYGAFVWRNASEGIIDLGTPVGMDNSGAFDIDIHGNIVGYAYSRDGQQSSSWIWSPSNGFTDLGVGNNAHAFGSNDLGQIVGSGFIWENGVARTLESNIATGYVAEDINNWGQVVGSADRGGGDGHERGVRAGGTVAVPPRIAFLWEDGTTYDLNELIPSNTQWERLVYANAINDLGQIVGTGLIDGEQRAFVLTPLPEPSSLMTLPTAQLGVIIAVGGGQLGRPKVFRPDQ